MFLLVPVFSCLRHAVSAQHVRNRLEVVGTRVFSPMCVVRVASRAKLPCRVDMTYMNNHPLHVLLTPLEVHF